MAATASEKKLLIAGEWVETGDWLEVRSPYSGEVVGRVAKAGAAEARRALAAGCAVVLKPASQTPLSALLLAELEQEAGLPPGWLNVVVGPASEIGDVLVEDERVRLISFTGSAEVGWKLRGRAATKKVLLELGNATPVIVEADADVAATAAKLAANAFSFAGQSCI